MLKQKKAKMVMMKKMVRTKKDPIYWQGRMSSKNHIIKTDY